jgi:hypothetical protein
MRDGQKTFEQMTELEMEVLFYRLICRVFLNLFGSGLLVGGLIGLFLLNGNAVAPWLICLAITALCLSGALWISEPALDAPAEEIPGPDYFEEDASESADEPGVIEILAGLLRSFAWIADRKRWRDLDRAFRSS